MQKQMRLLVDGVVFENVYQKGIQRYYREMLSRVGSQHQVEIYLSAKNECPMPQHCRIRRRSELFASHVRNYPVRLVRKLRRRYLPTRFKNHNLFHSTYFSRSLEPGLPEVVTVYDMIPERFESQLHQWGQAHIDKKLNCLEAAARVICISHATAADVAEIYPHLKSKLCVTQLGADHFQVGDFHKPATDNAHLLVIGDRHGYKNFDIVLKALKEPSWPAHLSVVVAGPRVTDSEREAVKSLGLESRIRFDGPVSDQQLSKLFQAATGFIFPSTYEGFGFPLLEAQSQGTPVLCSDIPVFHETAEESALFFNPNDPAALAGAVNKLLNSKVAELRKAGLENVKRFRWDKCAQLTMEIYQDVLNDSASTAT